MLSPELDIIISLFVICLLIAVLPIRLRIRESMMRNLAKEFKLNFHSKQAPRFIDFYTKILWERNIRKINHVEGILNNRTIHIYDEVHFSFLGTPYHCVIEIDGNVVNKTRKKFYLYEYFYDYAVANYFYPFSIKNIRKVLQNLR